MTGQPEADIVVAELVSERDLLVECQGEMQVVEEQIDHLRSALVSARRIGVALGILMGRYRLTDDEAFARLTQASQRTNRTLCDVAEDVRRTGSLEVP